MSVRIEKKFQVIKKRKQKYNYSLIEKMKTSHKIIIGDSRNMNELKKESVHLVVTSPPYWQLKDYGCKNQIGFHQNYEEYVDSLNKVWSECYRVLHPGCRLCVNIGDQFARAVIYGRYKIIPIRETVVNFCEKIGFDYTIAIIWQKVTTCKTTGGATVMGSYPYPRNGMISIDYEFILLFKKLGEAPKPIKEQKEKSKMTHEEWVKYFYGHWNFAGVKQNGHLAMFPDELPRRLIKMYSFIGETVLDPFLGSGTTSKVAASLDRNSVGYEVNPEFLEVIKQKLEINQQELFNKNKHYEIILQNGKSKFERRIKNRKQYRMNDKLLDPRKFNFGTRVSVAG